MNLTSIVILTYNGLEEATRPCLESLIKNTNGEFELIIVDNASNDGTQKYLKNLAKRYNYIKVKFNEKNKGFAAGNNDGIKLSNGRYIVLLNNDTLVPVGWLDRLKEKFDNNPMIGLLGPVTNSAGNEQRITLKGLTENNFHVISRGYTERNRGIVYETEMIGFFCSMIRKEVIEKIGYLDENFGIGMFEDDDYCLRAKNAGYKIAVAEDCFVYHKGSLSFTKISLEKYKTLFDENRTYFKKKHKIDWTLTDIAFSYLRKISGDISKYIENNEKVIPELERISVRLENFHHLLVQIHKEELKYNTDQKNIYNLRPNNRAIFLKYRLRQFYYSFIRGNYHEKRQYIRLLMRWVFGRLLPIIKSSNTDKIIAELESIRKSSIKHKKIIFPATIDYHYMDQRPQQLARAFAEYGYFVIYGTLNHKTDSVMVSQKIEENLYLLHEKYFPYLNHIFKSEDTIYFCLWPNNKKHIDYIPYSKIIYDYMDDLSLLDLPSEMIENDHRKMLEKADMITVTSDRLKDKIPENYIDKTLIINNAVSKEFIQAVENCSSYPSELKVLGNKPILGYYGAIAEWFDFDLIEKILNDLPNVQIVLIGPVENSVKSRLEKIVNKRQNLYIFSPKKQLELVPFLTRFDICLIPFINNRITESVSPVKLYEYFIAGKPIITTDLHECKKFSNITCVQNNEEFIDSLKYYLENRITNEHAENLKKYAKLNTWEHRVAKIIERLSYIQDTKN